MYFLRHLKKYSSKSNEQGGGVKGFVTRHEVYVEEACTEFDGQAISN